VVDAGLLFKDISGWDGKDIWCENYIYNYTFNAIASFAVCKQAVIQPDLPS
jgi:hypothetical protein